MKQKASHLSEEEAKKFIAGIRACNKRAFLQLQTDFYLPTVWFTYKFIDDWQASEGIVSETFEKVFLLRDSFNTIADLRAFIYVTCRNSAYNYLRDKGRYSKKETSIDDFDSLPINTLNTYVEIDNETENNILRVEMLRKMHAQIDLLTEKRRQILYKYMEGLNTDQIAIEMGISPGAVRKAKFKAIHVIKKNLLKAKSILVLLTCS